MAAGGNPGAAVRLPIAELAANWPEDDLWLTVDPTSERASPSRPSWSGRCPSSAGRAARPAGRARPPGRYLGRGLGQAPAEVSPRRRGRSGSGRMSRASPSVPRSVCTAVRVYGGPPVSPSACIAAPPYRSPSVRRPRSAPRPAYDHARREDPPKERRGGRPGRSVALTPYPARGRTGRRRGRRVTRLGGMTTSLEFSPAHRPGSALRQRLRAAVAAIVAAGLLKRRPGYYAVRLSAVSAAFAGGWVAFFALGDSWWQLAVAAFLAFVFGQVALVAHDVAHRQVFRRRRPVRSAGGCRQPRHRHELRLVDGQAHPAPRQPQPRGAGPGRRAGHPGVDAGAGAGRHGAAALHRPLPGVAVLPAAHAGGLQPARVERPGAAVARREAPRAARRRCCSRTSRCTSAALFLVLSPGKALAFLARPPGACSASTWARPSRPTTRACRC